MPSTVARTEAQTPTFRLFQAASSRAGVCGRSAYHCSVKPVSGNFGVGAVLIEKIGRKMTGR